MKCGWWKLDLRQVFFWAVLVQSFGLVNGRTRHSYSDTLQYMFLECHLYTITLNPRHTCINTKTCLFHQIGPRRIHTVRVRGGNKKYRALRIDVGNFSWGSECKFILNATLISWDFIEPSLMLRRSFQDDNFVQFCYWMQVMINVTLRKTCFLYWHAAFLKIYQIISLVDK